MEKNVYCYELTKKARTKQEKNLAAVVDNFGGTVYFESKLTKGRIPAAVINFIATSRFSKNAVEGNEVFGAVTSKDTPSAIDRIINAMKVVDNKIDKYTFPPEIHHHVFSIKANGKIVAEGCSPFIEFEDGVAVDKVTKKLKKDVEDICDNMFDNWRDTYDIVVFGLDETIHIPGKTVTLMFVRK